MKHLSIPRKAPPQESFSSRLVQFRNPEQRTRASGRSAASGRREVDNPHQAAADTLRPGRVSRAEDTSLENSGCKDNKLNRVYMLAKCWTNQRVQAFEQIGRASEYDSFVVHERTAKPAVALSTGMPVFVAGHRT